MENLFKKFFYTVSTIFLIGCIAILSILWVFSNELPDYKFLKNYKPPVSSKVYSGAGDLISDFSSQKRIFVPYNSIPKVIINSFLSAEDKNFFSHPGVDAKGVFRAVVKNISNIIYSKRLEGASTITQQVAKNFLLSNEVSFNRKLKEAILAFRIERALTKQRILELYLNQIYLGEGSYGIASASLVYFDKSINELNYSEAALLAALPKAPSKYNPYENIKLAKFRRNLVINNLYDNNYISLNKKVELEKSKIILKKRKKQFFEDTRYYIEDIRKYAVQKFGYDMVYKKGLSIKSPINLELQKIATESLRNGLENFDRRKGWRGALDNFGKKDWKKKIKKFKIEKSIEWKIARVEKIEDFEVHIITENNIQGKIIESGISWTNKEIKKIFRVGDIIYVKKNNNNFFELKQLPMVNGAITVMDPYTGRVYAISGGFSFIKSEFNRVTQALRQPGSAFKPFIYALALENNFSPSSIILDAPLVLDQGIDLKMWKPENYGKKFYGPSTLRVGLEKSRNLMTVRIAQKLGLEKIISFSKKIGIYENPDELLSISLGSAETTLLKLASAYCIFVNGGKRINPILIDRIQNVEGKTIYNTENRYCYDCDKISFTGSEIPTIKDNYEQVISSETSFQITSILEGVIDRGTGKKLNDINLELAGKTGTTNKNTDTWFVGYNSKYVVGVYVGMDDPKSLGKKETGSRTAMPIFRDFILKASKKIESKPFKIPKNISLMVVDLKTGKKADFGSKKTIIEAFKSDKRNIKNVDKVKINHFNFY